MHLSVRSNPKQRHAFSFVELLVVLCILGILVSIFVPYLMKQREMSNRTACQDNLRAIRLALADYAKDNRQVFPRVIYDAQKMPVGYRCYTGADSQSAFAADTKVAANDVTASLWLLIRGGYIAKGYAPASAVFICPSASHRPDLMTDSGGAVRPENRSNFRSRKNLSYSYASPFSNATRYGLLKDFLSSRFVLMADKNPGVRGKNDNVMSPAHDAPPLEMARANSNNHGKAGQSVLYGDMHVEFVQTPYCAVDGDNIYTALARQPIFTGQAPTLNSNGYCGKEIGPAWETDSYLVPTDDDR